MGKNVHDITKQRTLKERPILCMPTVSIGHDRMLLWTDVKEIPSVLDFHTKHFADDVNWHSSHEDLTALQKNKMNRVKLIIG